MALRIVARIDPKSARSGRFFIFSAAAHALAVLTVVFAPAFGGRTPPVPPSMFVDLVPGVPAAPAAPGPPTPAPQAPPPEPEPEAAEPEGVRAEERPVEPEKALPKPVEKPPPKKEKKPETTQPVGQSSAPKVPTPVPPPPTSAPGGGGGGTSAGEAGASVSPLGGGAGDVALGWYEGQVTSSLYRNWKKPLLDGIREPLEVHVAFEILRDGRVQDPRILQPSGVPSLDRSALRAVGDADPLPPLPANWREPVLPATFVFRLNPG